MRVFVSLIVWLFSVTGTDGTLSVRPSHIIAMKDSPITFTCASDRELMSWHKSKHSEWQMIRIVKDNCSNQDKSNFDVSYIQDHSHDPPLYRCDLILKPSAQVYASGQTMSYICEDFYEIGDKESDAWAILLRLESPMTCERRDEQLSCTLQHSAYKNVSYMFQYLEIRLEIRNPTGTVVASKSAGFMDSVTVITAPLDGGKSVSATNPYICTACIIRNCDNYQRVCVEEMTILSSSALQCKYFDRTDEARAVSASERTRSNAKRDNVIAMLLSLMTALIAR